MKIVSWILLVAVAVVVAAFAVANRSPVLLSLEPLGYVITLPLYALVIGTLFVGAVIGGGTTWLGAGKTRRAIRAARAGQIGSSGNSAMPGRRRRARSLPTIAAARPTSLPARPRPLNLVAERAVAK